MPTSLRFIRPQYHTHVSVILQLDLSVIADDVLQQTRQGRRKAQCQRLHPAYQAVSLWIFSNPRVRRRVDIDEKVDFEPYAFSGFGSK